VLDIPQETGLGPKKSETPLLFGYLRRYGTRKCAQDGRSSKRLLTLAHASAFFAISGNTKTVMPVVRGVRLATAGKPPAAKNGPPYALRCFHAKIRKLVKLGRLAVQMAFHGQCTVFGSDGCAAFYMKDAMVVDLPQKSDDLRDLALLFTDRIAMHL